MKRALNIQKELEAVDTVQSLTGVFENIASIRISQIKDQVLNSQKFFQELWHIYSQLRVDPKERLQRNRRNQQGKAFLIITSEAGLSGDIDQRIVDQMLRDYEGKKGVDIIAIGSHGSVLMQGRGVRPTLQYAMPPLANLAAQLKPVRQGLMKYESVTAYYQKYQSLSVQDIAEIDLISAVQDLGARQSGKGADIISSDRYLFEPSVEEVADFMESVMLEIALSQVVLDSRLAQFASRFNAMRAASDRAGEVHASLRRDYHKAKRSESDERLKEVVNGMIK